VGTFLVFNDFALLLISIADHYRYCGQCSQTYGTGRCPIILLVTKRRLNSKWLTFLQMTITTMSFWQNDY
jgi:hypothetical protein